MLCGCWERLSPASCLCWPLGGFVLRQHLPHPPSSVNPTSPQPCNPSECANTPPSVSAKYQGLPSLEHLGPRATAQFNHVARAVFISLAEHRRGPSASECAHSLPGAAGSAGLGGLEACVSVSSQAVPMLLVCGPHFEAQGKEENPVVC